MKKNLTPLHTMMLILWPLLLACFFATPNPYAALHSGNTGYESEQTSVVMAVNQALLMGVAIGTAWFMASKVAVRIPIILVVGLFAMVLSGLWTGVLFARPQSYAYDVVTMTLLSSLAALRSDNKVKSLYILSGLLLFLAVLAAYLQPDRWGAPNLEFSRFERGEFPLAYYVGCYVLFPQLSIATPIPRWIRFVGWMVAAGLAIATFTRTTAFLCVAPALIYVASRFKRRILYPIALLAIIYGAYAFLDFIDDLDYTEMNLLLTGRLDLWTYYWDAFLANPLFGSGAFFLEQNKGYSSSVVSEIGVLKTFGEYGLVWGGIQLWIVLVASVRAWKILRQGTSGLQSYCSLVVLSVLPIFLLEGFTRVLTANDAIFWYCTLYLYTRAQWGYNLSFVFPWWKVKASIDRDIKALTN